MQLQIEYRLTESIYTAWEIEELKYYMYKLSKLYN